MAVKPSNRTLVKNNILSEGIIQANRDRGAYNTRLRILVFLYLGAADPGKSQVLRIPPYKNRFVMRRKNAIVSFIKFEILTQFVNTAARPMAVARR